VTLIEPLARRVAFLTECVAELGLDRVQVVRGRAEDLTGEISADIVTARAVAPLDRLAGWATGLARPGGTVLAIKGAGARDELARATVTMRRLGVTDVEVLEVGSESAGGPATVVRFRAPARTGRASAGRPGSGGRPEAGRGGRRAAAGRGRGGRPAGAATRGPQERHGDG
jgi:16S rRNA (guanine527-N7)-methyltransferase